MVLVVLVLVVVVAAAAAAVVVVVVVVEDDAPSEADGVGGGPGEGFAGGGAEAVPDAEEAAEHVSDAAAGRPSRSCRHDLCAFLWRTRARGRLTCCLCLRTAHHRCLRPTVRRGRTDSLRRMTRAEWRAGTAVSLH